ncbi:DUF5053 domain-containing protein [Dysgonomonas termitidis]|uniref:DUF5053 domain-containing protein n=1 Tax=Dysgonomonas termitidis TaxID=1516126 RepID=A0ABV9KUI7_9BACT
MNQIEKYLAEWNTLETEEDYAAFDKKIKSEQAARSEEEKKIISRQFEEGAKKAVQEAEELIEFITVRKQLDTILPYVSISSIAKEYFGKSRQWFYQRLNNSKVNGKRVQFNNEEIKILSKALNEIGGKFQDTSISLINT